MKNPPNCVLTLAASLFLSGVASATVIDTTPVSGSIPTTTTNFTNLAIALPQFDAALGTLLSVTLTFSETANFSLSLIGGVGGTTFRAVTIPGIGTVPFETGIQESIGLQTGPGPTSTPLDSVSALTVVTNSTTTGVHANNGQTIGPYHPASPVTSSDTQVFSPSSFWIGNGNVTLLVSSQYTTVGSATGGQFTITGSGSASADAAVVYEYDDSTAGVPEPGTIGLLGSGLLAVIWAGRKRLLASR